MCFSAEASFAASAALTGAGMVALKNVSRPEQRLFAVIPLIFACQQFAEGVVWTTLKSGAHDRLQDAAAHVFLIAALIVWPVIVPLSVWLMEENRKRKTALSCLLVAGGAVSLYYTVCLILFDVFPRTNGLHIQYVDNFPGDLVNVAFGFYLASTVTPLFVSSVRLTWLFGALVAASCAVSGLYFSEYLTSVWCFFAALVSATICRILSESRHKERLAPEQIRL